MIKIHEDGTVKVADFGSSRFALSTELLSLGKMRGTYSYTAPEVFNYNFTII
jgi:serine/threonine protein kinase